MLTFVSRVNMAISQTAVLSYFYLAIIAISSVTAVLTHKKFEYKFSFKGPNLVQRDGSIPFWEHGGHAIASDESIRITPSLRSKKGYVWTKNVVTFEHWEVEFTFKVSGRGRIGADGLAFWFTRQRGTEGPVFGSNDKWDGLAVFFDSFDNDGQHNNPYISAMVNDGMKTYDHASDGSSQQLGGCMRDFRNKPFPIRFKLEYFQNTLTMFINNGVSNNPNQYEMCMRAENVVLPNTGYFGISGATGGLADDHDVLSFITHSLTPRLDGPDSEPQVSEEDRVKYQKEFDEYHEKLRQAKEDYRRQHPDARPEDFERDMGYESQDIQELKMIFQGQANIHETIKQLNHKLDEMVGRQEMTLSQITNIKQQAGSVQQGGATNQQGQVGAGDSIKRFEVDQLLNNQRDVTQNLRDIRSFVNDLQSKVNLVQQTQQNMQKQQPAGGGTAGGGYDYTKHANELKDMMHGVQNDMRTISAKQTQPPASCPPSDGGCVTTLYLFIMLAVQMVIFIAYVTYKNSKEAAAKKFY